MVASDGGVFTFGDAAFYGSMGGQHLNSPITGIVGTPDGKGYWEVAADGGIFVFGDATFYGSMGGKPLNRPVVGIAAAGAGSAGPPGVVTLYNSTTPQGLFSQAFNGPQITQFGDAVNLTSNPTGAALGTLAVTLVNWGLTAFSTPIRVTLYNVGQGGVVGSELATLSQSVAVPAASSASVHKWFTATFDFSSQHIVLPDTVVYGITFNQLVTDCSTTPADCGNDPNPVGSLNIALSPNVSSGTNAYPDAVYVSSRLANSGGSALESALGGCPGTPTGVLIAFQGIPVSCANGYAGNVEGGGSGPTPYFLGTDTMPSVEFTTVG